MNLTKERQKEKKARDSIHKALEEFFGCEPKIPEFTEKRIPGDRYHEELTARGIEAGVTALVLVNNMAGASGSDIHLFQLLQKYLLDKNTRDEINRIVMKA